MHAAIPPAQIGLGCVTFGREIDAGSAYEILDYAWAHGVRVLDTAPSYGDGASERILGEWLRDRQPPSPLISTKVAPPYTAQSLRASLDASLKRLRRSSVDILFAHRFDVSLVATEVLETLDSFVRERRVMRLGISNATALEFEQVLREQHLGALARFSWLQNNHNLAVRGFSPELRSLCVQEQIQVMTYSPLAAGFLTGKHRNTVADGSRFAVVPGHQAIYFQPDAKRRLDELLTLAAQHSLPPEHLALNWALNQPGVDYVLVGARKIEQVQQALTARTAGLL